VQIKDTSFSSVVQKCTYIHTYLPFHNILPTMISDGILNSFPAYYLLWEEHTADQHMQQPYIANQQGWREWDYLVAIVGAKQHGTKTATSSPTTPAAARIRHQCLCLARNPRLRLAAQATGSCNVLANKPHHFLCMISRKQ
jgi:hypothetical protein